MTISDNTQQASVSYNKSKPFLSRIKEKWLLTKPGSTKQTYHVSLCIQNADISFRPGDSIGILPQNDPGLVHKLLALTATHQNEEIQDPRSNETMSAQYYLTHKVNLTRINSSLIKFFFEQSLSHDKKNFLAHLLEKDNKEVLSRYLQERDLIDVLGELQEKKFHVQELCQHFTPLLPRFYSISSSQLVYPNEIHLTVALFSFSHRGEQRYGVASHFLCHLAEMEKTPIPIYVQPAQHFHLPADPNANIIMVGPGTGIAPYRAFLQERVQQGASGKNWLFFGERTRQFDYFYEDYWEKLVQENKLRLDLAFSRDQQEKVYVQHKLYSQAREVWEWLEQGAYFYLCGDATRMAKDVEQTLLCIFKEQGHLSDEEAKAYFKALKQSKRYLADVY
jgi:sulfite reductase (NADPH) flavoprotein alpha-component